MSTDPVFALVDVNAFYAACHQVFEPGLIGKPLVVLSANDGNVVARSPEARFMGIKMGTPLFEIRDLLEQQRMFARSSTFALYADMSQRVQEVLAQFAEVEPYSIDEAFLRVPPDDAGRLMPLASAIRERVVRWTGLHVAVGFGPTKTVAKLANRQAKRHPAGVVDLSQDAFEREALLAETPVQEIWGLGSRSTRTLRERGIYSARQLIQLPDAFIRQLLGIRGVRLVWELRGTPTFPFQQEPPSPKSISRARVFGHPLHEQAEIAEAIQMYVSLAAEKLRRHHLAVSALSVFIGTNAWRKKTPQYSNACTINLGGPTNSTLVLIQAMQFALAQIFKAGYAYSRAGVHLIDLVPEIPRQASFFVSEEEQAREQRLMRTIDRLNQRYGRETITIGTATLEHPRSWQQRAAYASGRWTTRWTELPVVLA